MQRALTVRRSRPCGDIALAGARRLRLSLATLACILVMTCAANATDVPHADLAAIEAGATAGHSDDQFRLGTLTYMGLGARQDWAVAAGWLHKAADQGHAEAQCELAMMYQIGSDGVVKDIPHAAALYRVAADAGDPVAAFGLAALLTDGAGIAHDDQRAAALLRTVAAAKPDLDGHGGPLGQLYHHFLSVAAAMFPIPNDQLVP